MKAEIINGKAIAIKEINNQRLITFKEIDDVHNRPEGTAKRNFTENKKHLIKDEDYYTIKPSDFLKYEIRTLGFPIPNRGLTLITESGYLMIVKSLNDDLAWKVQRELVNTYFRVKKFSNDKSLTFETILQTLLTQQQEQRQSQESFNQQFIQTLSQAQQAQTAQLTALTTLITSTLPQPYKPPFTRWMAKTLANVDIIAEERDQTRRQTLHQLYNELQDTYDIDLNEYAEEYCYAHNLQNTGIYTLNTIGADKQLNQLFDLLLNTYVEQTQLVSN